MNNKAQLEQSLNVLIRAFQLILETVENPDILITLRDMRTHIYKLRDQISNLIDE